MTFKNAFKESIKTRIRRVMQEDTPHTINLVGGILRNAAADYGNDVANQIIDELQLQESVSHFKG